MLCVVAGCEYFLFYPNFIVYLNNEEEEVEKKNRCSSVMHLQDNLYYITHK